uniref:Mantle gene 3 n=1 Tax=Pinctada fucata TaxID=50426 RepID=Q3YL63_PINFU|nr:mantle gene 3 [Pinctada fucata]
MMDRYHLLGSFVVFFLILGFTQGRITVDCKRGCRTGNCFNFRCPFYPCKRRTDKCHDRLAVRRGAFCRPEYCGGCFAKWYIWMYPVSTREIDVTHRCNRGRRHLNRPRYQYAPHRYWHVEH